MCTDTSIHLLGSFYSLRAESITVSWMHRIRKRGKEQNQTHIHCKSIFILKDSWFTSVTAPVLLLLSVFPLPKWYKSHLQTSCLWRREHRTASCELTLAGISTGLFPEPCPALSIVILTSKSHLLHYHHTEDRSSHIPGWREPNQTKYRLWPSQTYLTWCWRVSKSASDI